MNGFLKSLSMFEVNEADLGVRLIRSLWSDYVSVYLTFKYLAV